VESAAGGTVAVVWVAFVSQEAGLAAGTLAAAFGALEALEGQNLVFLLGEFLFISGMRVDQFLLSRFLWRGSQTDGRRGVGASHEGMVTAERGVLVLLRPPAHLRGLLLAVLLVQVGVCARVLQRYVLTLTCRVATDHEFVARVVSICIEADSIFGVLRHVDVVEVFLLGLVDVARVGLLQRTRLSTGSVAVLLRLGR